VIATAKKNLELAEELDGEGGYTVYGNVVEAPQADNERLLPMGLCHGAKIVRPVAQGKMLTYADVQMPEGGFAQHLRKVQDGAAI